MPHYAPHAVYNLDETVAVGDNPFFNTAIEEAAFVLHKTNLVAFSDITGSKITVLDCKF